MVSSINDEDIRVSNDHNIEYVQTLLDMHPQFEEHCLLRSNLYNNNTKSNQRHKAYLCACLGISLNSANDIPSQNILETFVDIIDLGGITQTNIGAKGISKQIVNEMIKDNDITITRNLMKCFTYNLNDSGNNGGSNPANDDFVDLVTPINFKLILTRGYLNPLPVDPKLQERSNIWNTLTAEQKEILRTLYPNRSSSLGNSFVMDPIPDLRTEQYVRYFDSSKPETIKAINDKIKVLSPPGVSLSDYMKNNFLAIKKILNRDSKMLTKPIELLTRNDYHEYKDHTAQAKSS